MRRVFMMEIDSGDTSENRESTPVVHYASALGEDYTLCGVAYDEDARFPDESATSTRDPVDCERCIVIRDYCRTRT